jgi:copper chaperone
MESIKINGMSCQHCVASVKKALEALPGISAVTVDLSSGSASFANNGVARDDIKKAISKIGFEPLDT